MASSDVIIEAAVLEELRAAGVVVEGKYSPRADGRVNLRVADSIRAQMDRMIVTGLARPLPGRREMIQIEQSKTADTRTCDFANVSKETLLASSRQHIEDVREGLRFFRHRLYEAGERHDTDKLDDIDGFHADFITGFKQTGWWDRHRKLNRHHLLQADGVPEDVNLVDVLDMIADCVMAGMARSGSVYPLDIPDDVLRRAFQNTVVLLQSQVEVAPATPTEERADG